MTDYTDEERELLISLGIAPEELAQLEQEQGYADELRSSHSDPTINAGRVVAPNYAVIGDAFRQRKGNEESRRIKGEKEAVLARILRGRNLWDRPDRMEAQNAPMRDANEASLAAIPSPVPPMGGMGGPPAPQAAPPPQAGPAMASPGGVPAPRPVYQPLGEGTHENRSLEAQEFLRALAQAARSR